ncbi:MAG: PspC domain-containing protein [Clostridiales Family XIII bacterium]|nr:PspC domain-containing protein [Clostridiales Family XIII bacterium]
MAKKLYRSQENKVLAGICGGIGEYFNIDPVLIRILWVVFTLMGGAGIIGYIIALFIVPKPLN